MTYEEKIQQLSALLTDYTKTDCIVAFSGGVDSSLLLKLACRHAAENGTIVHAVTMKTRLHPVREIHEAARIAKEIGAKHQVMVMDELSEAGIDDNPVDRCYLCKKCLFGKLKDLASALGTGTVLEGTNEDDLHVYRPGLRALKELGIHSPLAEAGLTKKEVRRLCEAQGLSVSHKPSNPCMATRFPYGTHLSYDAMQKAAECETYIRGLGFYNVRVRVHGDTARIEVDAEDLGNLLALRQEIVSELKRIGGYSYVTADLEGFRSGSMDVPELLK